MNDQRKVIYEQRADIMDADRSATSIEDMRAETVDGSSASAARRRHLSRAVGRRGAQGTCRRSVRPRAADRRLARRKKRSTRSHHRAAPADGRRQDGRKDRGARAGALDEVEKNILIQTLDHHWKEHLATLDALRQVIHLRSYAQKKPIDEYKQEAFLLFERLLVVDPRGCDARR